MARVAKEISYVETRPGLFEPAPTRAQLRRKKQETEKRRQNREEYYLLFLGALMVICCAALGAWQGHLMVSG
jgi:hypothetical protein